MALPMDACPPLTLLRRDLARKKKTRSKMKARRVTLAPKPEIHVLRQEPANSDKCARSPKMAEPAAKQSATIWRTRAYVTHFTTT